MLPIAELMPTPDLSFNQWVPVIILIIGQVVIGGFAAKAHFDQKRLSKKIENLKLQSIDKRLSILDKKLTEDKKQYMESIDLITKLIRRSREQRLIDMDVDKKKD